MPLVYRLFRGPTSRHESTSSKVTFDLLHVDSLSIHSSIHSVILCSACHVYCILIALFLVLGSKMSALAVDADVGLEGEGMNYPRGGLATSAGGDGMFIDQSGECLKLFVDPRVGSARRIIKAAEVSPLAPESSIRTT